MYQCILALLKLNTPIVKKLLRIQVNSRPKFNKYLDGMIKKTSRKFNVFSRVATYININKKCILMKRFLFKLLIWDQHQMPVGVRLFLPVFLVEGFSVSGRLVFLKRFKFILIFLICKFVFRQLIFSSLFWLT